MSTIFTRVVSIGSMFGAGALAYGYQNYENNRDISRDVGKAEDAYRKSQDKNTACNSCSFPKNIVLLGVTVHLPDNSVRPDGDRGNEEKIDDIPKSLLEKYWNDGTE